MTAPKSVSSLSPGNVVDLHAFLTSDVKEETKLYTTGAPYVIPKPTAG